MACRRQGPDTTGNSACFMLLRFKRLAQNEAGVLEAFQDENWPARVELEIPSELDPVHKTNDAVFDLNRGQKLFLVRFFCDGTKFGICWELVK